MYAVYIAGPFRAKNGWELTKNVRKAEDAIGDLMIIPDVLPVCPHTMFKNFDRTKNDKFWIDATLELMRRCDSVLVLEGHEHSEGTKGEIAEAKRLGIPVFYRTTEVFNWVGERLANETSDNSNSGC